MSDPEETEQISAQEEIKKLREALAATTQSRDEEREKRLKAEEETRQTTLPEYLKLCHDYLSESITVQTDKSLSTQGDPSNTKGKYYPDRIQPWKEFIDTQKETLGSLYSIYPSDDMAQAFDSRHFLKTQGGIVARRPLASEQDLVIVQRDIVETPVTRIVEHLNMLDDVREQFTLEGGFEFYNHMNNLNDGVDEVDDQIAPRLKAQQLDPSTPRRAASSIFPSLFNCRPDQICVLTRVDNTMKPTLVVEYKAPHKVTRAHLRYVLHLDRLPLELETVINRVKVPLSRETQAYFEYHAEHLVTAVIT